MKTLLLDIGNVLMGFDFDRARPRYAAACTVAGDPLEHLATLKYDLEIGKIDGDAFVSAGMQAIGFQGSAADFRRIWEEIFTPIDAMWGLVREVRATHRLLLLSNTSDIHKDCLFRDHEIFGSFSGGIYSYSSRCLKPDPLIFRKAIEELSLVPQETLYVDDLEDNIRVASDAGFAAVRYDQHDHDAFLREARALGLRVPED